MPAAAQLQGSFQAQLIPRGLQVHPGTEGQCWCGAGGDCACASPSCQAVRVCWSLSCQGAQTHCWVKAPAKSIFAGGGGFAEESTALLSEMDALQGQLGQRETGRGCEGHREGM